MRKQSFTFTFTIKVNRKTADKILDAFMMVLDLLGLELGIDFTGGFNLESNNKK